MFEQIVKIIWKQRKSNGWIFAELLVVIGALWLVVDQLLVDVRTYNLPLGFDIENTFRLKLGELTSQAPGYVTDEQRSTTETEDLVRLMEQIRLNNEVEEVCFTYYSCPYANGSSYTSIEPVDGDTTGLSTQSFQVRRVTPEYFTVFRVKDKDGSSIIPQLEATRSSIVISADMEERFYKGQSGKGRSIKRNEAEVAISAVCQPVRIDDYAVSEPCFYEVMVGGILEETVQGFGASRAELCVRMKKDYTPDQMNAFLESMGDRLVVNNLYVYGNKKFTLQREDMIREHESTAKIKIALMAFMLVNVFFGIIGTFWLRTQYRRGEIGLRVALGSSRSILFRYVNWEGLTLLLLTLPIILFFVGNMALMDLLGTDRLSLSFWRIMLVTAGSYLLMAGMICLGIWFPARKSVSLPPAEALRYE